MYEKTNKEAKQVASDAKFKVYNGLYNREWKKHIFKFEKIRERKSRDLVHVKCIKSNDQNVLVKGNDIKDGRREYFNKLLNEDYIGDISTWEDSSLVELTFCLQN